MQDWNELNKLVGNEEIIIERVRIKRTGVAIEGAFRPPKLTLLTADEEVFVAAFVRSHGSIKKMGEFFGVSYPTIKNRLNQIGRKLEFVEIEAEPDSIAEPSESGDILDRLKAGEISVDDAINEINERKKS
jgi:hypothetical protein